MAKPGWRCRDGGRTLTAPPGWPARGYAVAVQDKRGRYKSEGVYTLMGDDGDGVRQ